MIQNSSNRAVVLLSGGIDSSTVLAIANADKYDIYAMSFDYNQRHLRELESAKIIARAFSVKKHLVVKIDLREIGGSALTSEIDVPKKLRAERKKAEKNMHSKIPVTYVPARNTIFLSFALAWAEVIGAENIFIGANAIDYSGYPDCRPEYISAFEDMANLATKASIEGRSRFFIKAPLISMKKSDIIMKGAELGLDYSRTWSCYDPQLKQVQSSNKKSKVKTSNLALQNIYMPCGLCDSCRLRKKGFKEAGIEDTLSSIYTI